MMGFSLRQAGGLLATVLVAAVMVSWILTPGELPGWLGHALVGNFGQSAGKLPVAGLIGGALAVTVPLSLMAMLIATGLGLGLGMLAARRPGSAGDRLLKAAAAIGMATPQFWLGMVLALILATGLHVLPPGGFVPWTRAVGGAFASLLLPALTLAVAPAGALGLATRATMAGLATAPHVQAAIARGSETGRGPWPYGIGAPLLRLATPLSLQFAAIVAGSVIVENVFYLPGLGRLILDAVAAHDAAIVRGALAVLVLLICGTSFFTQFGLAWLDPRLRAADPA